MKPRPSVPAAAAAVYLVDQDRATTSSLGIFNYASSLVRHLALAPDPGFRVRLWVSETNAADMVPRTLPDWMEAVRVPGRYGTGARRLWADHVLAPRLARRQGVGLVHYPKGWLPLAVPRGVKSVATLHDTILFYYARQHPGFFPRTKLAYFLAMTRWTLRRADRIVTGTQDSARALSALCPAAASRITLMAPGGVEDAVPAAAAAARKGVLVIGSRLPHKATAETLRLLAGYARRRATRLAVQVSGLDDGNGVTAAADAQALDLTFHGRVDNATMRSLMQGVRALVFLSRIEGFGLPLLEAYSAGTPVCYRNRSAMRDVMAGAPGGWDGRSAESFDAALDEALNLPPDRVAAVRASLRERYRWDDIAQRMLTVYREVLDDRP